MDKASHTREDFEEAFWRLYARKPLDKITVRELTEEAGYNRGTFYLHYRDIYDLFDTLEQSLLDQVEACTASCPDNPGKADLVKLMARMLALYERNRTPIVLLLGARGDAAFIRRLRALMKRMPIWSACDPGLDISPGERDLRLEQAVAGVLFLVGSWLEDDRGVSAASLLHLIYETAIKRP